MKPYKDTLFILLFMFILATFVSGSIQRFDLKHEIVENRLILQQIKEANNCKE